MSRQGLPVVRGLRIQGEKIVSYLLNPTHPRGAPKAKYLLGFGFSADALQLLADALADHFTNAPNARDLYDEFGARRIVCEGPIRGVDGREPWIRSVWLFEQDHYARLVTVVPLPGRGTESP